MIAQFAIVAFVGFFLTGAGHYFLYAKVFFPLFSEAETLLQVVFFVLWAVLFLGFGIIRILPASVRKYFEAFMFVWMGYALFLIFASVPVLAGAWILSFDVTETQTAAAIWGLGSVLSGVSFLLASKEEVFEVDLPLIRDQHRVEPGTTPAADAQGLRAVVLSDVHVTGLVGHRRLTRIVERVNALQPDLIFITGDLVDGSVKQLAGDVAALGGLKSRAGVYFVTGNHEYYSGAQSWKKHITDSLGWTVLENSSQSLELSGVRLSILGIEDRQSLVALNGRRRPDTRLDDAVATVSPEGLSSDRLNVLLAHQPKDARRLVEQPQVDLQISGHTHSGQIWPFSWFVMRDQGFLRGLYDIGVNQKLYVTQGTTYWGPPFRLGTSCEISLLRIQPVPKM